MTRDAQFLEALCGEDGLVVDGSHRKDSLKDASSTHRMAITAFVGIDGDVCQTSPLDGHRLHLVVENRSCAVGINESQGFFVVIIYDGLQSEIGAFAVLSGVTDMGGIVADGARAEGPVPRSITQDHRGGCLAKVQPHALHIEGTARFWRKGFQRLEA